jgi:hypothetical protein
MILTAPMTVHLKIYHVVLKVCNERTDVIAASARDRRRVAGPRACLRNPPCSPEAIGVGALDTVRSFYDRKRSVRNACR